MAKDIEIYTLNEVGEILQVTKRSLYNWIKSGKLEAFHVGREWRVSKESLERFMTRETHTHKATAHDEAHTHKVTSHEAMPHDEAQEPKSTAQGMAQGPTVTTETPSDNTEGQADK